MQKITFTFLAFLSFSVSVQAQILLDVCGDGWIRERLIVGNTTDRNLFIGHEAGVQNSGDLNTFVGNFAGSKNTTGRSNTFFGSGAGELNTTGVQNTFLGLNTGNRNIGGNNNVYVGDGAGFHNLGSENVLIGQLAGFSSLSSNYSNSVFVGSKAGLKNTASWNTFIGEGAGFENTSGPSNAFIGSRAGFNNTTGGFNTFIGSSAGFANTSGILNVFIGGESADKNTIGSRNVFVGTATGSENTSGVRNVFVGFESGNGNTVGGENTYIGINAGATSETGAHNTCLGAFSDVTNAGLVNATALGYIAFVDASNKVRIGNGDVTVIEGEVNFSSTSDKRLKKQIREESTDAHHNFILGLTPVSYQFKKTKPTNKTRYSGFLAQDVEKTANETGYEEFSGIVKPEINGGKYALRYAEFVVPLVGAVQEQQALIEEQQEQINERDDRISQLEEDVAELKAILEKVLEGKSTQSIQSTTIESARLGQNLPNPFNTSTKIPYTIPTSAQKAKMLIHGINGQLIKTIAINSFGEGTLELQTVGLSKGQYTYSLEVDGRLVETKQMQLVR